MLREWLFLVLLFFLRGRGGSVTPITVQAREPGLQVAWLSYSHTTAKRHSNKKSRA